MERSRTASKCNLVVTVLTMNLNERFSENIFLFVSTRLLMITDSRFMYLVVEKRGYMLMF